MEIQSGPTRVATPQTKTQDTSTKRELPQTGRAAELQRLNNEASTLKSQSDINARTVDTPIRKSEPTTITQNSPITEAQPTTYIITQLPERPDINQDPRVLKINGLISYLRQEAKIASEFENGARRNFTNTQEEINDSGFFMWASGGLEGLKQTLEQDRKLLKIRIEDRIALGKALATSEVKLSSAISLEQEGRKLEKMGRLEDAQDAYNQAQLQFTSVAKNIAETLQSKVDSSIKVKEVINGLAQANNTLANAEQNLDKTETGLRIVRNIAITTGATVATGGMATVCVGAGYGLTATFAISVATGTATGVGIGALSSTAEVVNSNRTFSEGTELILKNAVGDAKTAAIASLAAASGMTFTNVIAKPGSAILVSNTKRIFLAAGSGGVASATTKLVEIPIEYVEAVVDFQEQYGDRPKEERDELYKQFMAERRLSWKQIGYDSAIDIAVGFLSAGVGGKCKISAEAKKTFLRKLSTESADAAAGVFIGLGSAYVKNGELTFEDCISELGNATSGFAQGYMTERQRNTTPYKDGEIKIGNKKVTITATQPTKDGFGVVKVSEPEVLQKMYEAVRAREVGNELASREAQGVVGFCDTAKRQVIVLNDPNEVITKSIKLHEKIHADGAKHGNSVEQEINAYKAQLEYLQKNGFTIDFSDKGAFIKELGSQEEPPKIDEIKRFVEKNIDTESRYPTAKTENTAFKIPPSEVLDTEFAPNGNVFLAYIKKQYIENLTKLEMNGDITREDFIEKSRIFSRYEKEVKKHYKDAVKSGDKSNTTFAEFLIDDLKGQNSRNLLLLGGKSVEKLFKESTSSCIYKDGSSILQEKSQLVEGNEHVIFRELCTDVNELSLDGNIYAQKRLGFDFPQKVIETGGEATIIRGPKGAALNYIRGLKNVTTIHEYITIDGHEQFRKFVYEDNNGKTNLVLECHNNSYGYAKQIYGCCELIGIPKEKIKIFEAHYPIAENVAIKGRRLGEVKAEHYTNLFESFNIEPDCILIGDSSKFLEHNNFFRKDGKTVRISPNCQPIKTENFNGYLCKIDGKQFLVCQITPYMYGPQMGEFAKAVSDLASSSGKEIRVIQSGTAGGIGDGLEVGDVIRYSEQKGAITYREGKGVETTSNLKIKSVETPLVEDNTFIDSLDDNTVIDCEYGFLAQHFSKNPNVTFEAVLVVSDKPGTKHSVDSRTGTEASEPILKEIFTEEWGLNGRNLPLDAESKSNHFAQGASKGQYTISSDLGTIVLELPDYIEQDSVAKKGVQDFCEYYLQYGNIDMIDSFDTFLGTQYNASIKRINGDFNL